MGRSTTVHAKERDKSLTVSQHDTDAPILPMAQLEKLKELFPDKVDWIFEQATMEGQFRRAETKRVNTFVFIERFASILSGLIIGCLALAISAYLSIEGHQTVAGIIGGTTVVGLVSAFVIGSRKKQTKS